MAKRKRSRKKRNSGTRTLIWVLVVIAIFLGVYAGHHFYRIWNQQRIEQQMKKQDQEAKERFIKQVAPEAQAMQNTYHVYASITIAQAILESQWGTSKLASQYHNLFGIKGTGPNSKELSTKEYVNGKWVVTTGRFRVYDSWSDSIKDHTKLMLTGTDTNQQNYDAVVKATSYQEAAKALQEAGYATDPNYAQKLISVIKTYKLYNYDK
ncbi:glycoside hydrolase family 73 protein [Limosilactobacillus sp.]|uniref:glycoside hydrolase family 73 protein n=1 Tax=Limosilactobacillus sp. TaxID=2773925 RepID=UPI0025C09277|nr:glycoside hydrolase family 73 protein [Limosilactobacillus sp.]MCH3921223.1 glycoside hydrolase family 73 protein [Limosilactobacillus sp.]MCH3927994.1 glycoside hydrolase family 73 protein [Limosilactobacillus sp.]